MRYLLLILSFTLISASAFSQEKDSIYTIVEEMPRFPGCEDIEGTAAEKKKCAEKKMLQYVYKNIRYPIISQDNIHLLDKKVIVSFIVEKDGCLSNVEVIRGATDTVNEMYIKLISDMPCWISGKHFGENVAVKFMLPVRVCFRS